MAVALVCCATAVAGQTPRFTVASIKVNNSGGGQKKPAADFVQSEGAVLEPPRGVQVNARGATARTLVRYAYGDIGSNGQIVRPLEAERVTGGPAWLSQTSFDIDARMDNASYGPLERAVMMRLLLEERFRLRAHRDTRELPVYHLVFARADRKLGPQLRVLTSPCVPRINGVTGEETPCAVRTGPGNISGHGVAMAAIATYLSPVVGRIVVDRTGLTGRFDLALKFAVTPGVNPDLKATSFADTPSIFSAVQEQLGLRLESARSAVDVIVVDDIQRPTEN